MRDILFEQILKTLQNIEGLLSDWLKARAIAAKHYGIAYKDLRETSKRRARGGHHTPRQWGNLKAFYNFTCLSCGRREPEIRLTRDHVNPKGSNDITNIQPLCIECNHFKDAAHIDYRGTDQAVKAIRSAKQGDK